MKKTMWPIFSRIIECDKPQGTIFKGPQAILTITVELIRAFLEDLRGCWKHQFLKKRQYFQWKRLCGLFFLVLSNVTNLRVQFLRVHKLFWQLCRIYKSISWGPERLLKTPIFEKKAIFPVKKTLWPIFSRIIECDKPPGKYYKGPEDILVITVEPIRAFFRT